MGKPDPPAQVPVEASGAIMQATAVDAAEGAAAVADPNLLPALGAAADIPPSPAKPAPKRGGKGARNE